MSEMLHCAACDAPLEATLAHCPACRRALQPFASPEQQQARIHDLCQTIAYRAPAYGEATELGELYLALGQPAEAEAALRLAINSNPSAMRPRFLLCLALMGFNQPVLTSKMSEDEFQAHCRWLHTHYANVPGVRWLGFCVELDRMYQEGDWQPAKELARAASAEFPDNYILQFMYGLALLRFGDTDGLTRADLQMGLDYLQLAARLNPNYEPAMKAAAFILDLIPQAEI